MRRSLTESLNGSCRLRAFAAQCTVPLVQYPVYYYSIEQAFSIGLVALIIISILGNFLPFTYVRTYRKYGTRTHITGTASHFCLHTGKTSMIGAVLRTIQIF